VDPSASSLDLDLLVSGVAALIAGLIIGLERQIAIVRDNKPSPDIGGVRTFPLIALVGALSAYLAPRLGAWLVAAVLLGLVALIAAHHLGKPQEERDPGLTTEAAALATLLIGALAGSTHGSLAALSLDSVQSRIITPAALAVVIALVLSVKERLHEITRRIGGADLLAILQLIVVAVVFLPLVPDKGYGPYLAINPAQVMKMMVFIGSIGLIGFLATVLLGAGRALLVTGLVGGLVSSTAVTFSMARRAKESPALVCTAALSIVAASSVMFLRVLAAAAVVYPALLPRLAASMSAMFVCGVLAAIPVWRAAKDEEKAKSDLEMKNPFELKSAALFGVAFAAVILASRFLRDTFGDGALYVAALVAGLTDVDAITLSTANLAKDGLALEVASGVIVAACVSNTVVKGGIAWTSGGRALGVKVARVFGAMIAGGALAIVLQHLIG
jgi:uncharacterized membrane protein (DUF4010 family)